MRYTRKLGEGVTPANNPAITSGFVQGGNQIQTFILIVVVSVVALYLIAILAENAKKDKNKNQSTPLPNPANENVTLNRIEPPNTNVNPNPNIIVPTPTTAEPAHASVTHELQWLLNQAGYNTGGIDGVWGTYSNIAMRNFESAYKIPFQSSIASAIPVVRQKLRERGVLRGAVITKKPSYHVYV